MTRSKVFPGKFTENNRVLTNKGVSVFSTPREFSIRKHEKGMYRGEQLTVPKFHQNMFWEDSVPKGYCESKEGTPLGTYMIGPNGHPADGEYSIFTVNQLTVSGEYSQDGLTVCISAKAGKGAEYYLRDQTVITPNLPKKNIVIEFFVALDDLEEFLGHPDIKNVKKAIVENT